MPGHVFQGETPIVDRTIAELMVNVVQETERIQQLEPSPENETLIEFHLERRRLLRNQLSVRSLTSDRIELLVQTEQRFRSLTIPAVLDTGAIATSFRAAALGDIPERANTAVFLLLGAAAIITLVAIFR